jgi:hypothetical protein
MTTKLLRTTSLLFPFVLAAAALTGCDIAPVDSTGRATSAISDACPDSVPAALTPAADQNLAWVFDASGVQIYACRAAGAGYAWTFVAPRADLFNEGGQIVGKHYAGPTWEANDGSTIVGAKVAAATVDTTAIPWLLLDAVSHNSVDGRFSDVSSVQRLETVGGIAPASGCDAAHVGAVSEVPYSARYAMYKTKPNGAVSQCGQ